MSGILKNNGHQPQHIGGGQQPVGMEAVADVAAVQDRNLELLGSENLVVVATGDGPLGAEDVRRQRGAPVVLDVDHHAPRVADVAPHLELGGV